jgi:hypothetical protein
LIAEKRESAVRETIMTLIPFHDLFNGKGRVLLHVVAIDNYIVDMRQIQFYEWTACNVAAPNDTATVTFQGGIYTLRVLPQTRLLVRLHGTFRCADAGQPGIFTECSTHALREWELIRGDNKRFAGLGDVEGYVRLDAEGRLLFIPVGDDGEEARLEDATHILQLMR